MRAPLFVWGGCCACLESEPQTELQLAHTVWSIRGCVAFDILNAAWIAAGAVNASVALIGIEAEHRVIKYVVCVEAELCLDALSESEVLRQRHIGEESTRAAERIQPNIANCAARWQRERTGSRPRQGAGVG